MNPKDSKVGAAQDPQDGEFEQREAYLRRLEADCGGDQADDLHEEMELSRFSDEGGGGWNC